MQRILNSKTPAFRRCFTFSNQKAFVDVRSCKFSAQAVQFAPYEGYYCREEHSVSDCYEFSRVLHICLQKNNPNAAMGFHCHAFKSGMKLDLFALNILLNVYVKLDLLSYARPLFVEMSERNTVSFVTLMQGYLQCYEYTHAFELFVHLHRDGYELNPFVFTTVLKLLVTVNYGELTNHFHASAYKLGHVSSAFVGTALIDSYSVAGLLMDARKVFDDIPEKDVVSWTGMLACYSENNHGEEALRLFFQMNSMGLKSNNYTFSSLFKACSTLLDLNSGRSIHALAIKTNCVTNPYVGASLLDMYDKCGGISEAQKAFDTISAKNLVLWSFMISRYAQNNQGKEALKLFGEMRHASIVPNHFSLSSVLQACSSIKGLELGRQVHGYLVKIGYDSHVYVVNALTDVYVKCGEIEDSMKLFVGLKDKNDVTWNTMIVGFSQMDYGEEALRLFCLMHNSGVLLSQVTYSSVLKACASLASIKQGSQIQSLCVKTSFSDDIVINNSLIDMYAKCGDIKGSRKVFDFMTERDKVSWNAIISGYSLHGLAKEALEFFQYMIKAGAIPDKITFIAVLSACGNMGLVDQGRLHFNSMNRDYGIQPCMEHYTCMIRLVARFGHFDEAMKLTNELPSEPSVMFWRALLSACVIHKNVELGSLAAERVLEIEPQDDCTYVMLSNLYASVGVWEKVAQVRKNMRYEGVKKEPGLSWIEIHGEIHLFSVGDNSHPEIRLINGMLQWLNLKIRKEGFIPHRDAVLHCIEDTQKDQLLWVHSERLALAYGLLRTPVNSPIRIIKNLRFCADCHTAITFISKVVHREIVVRDINRFHHFEKGICSCGDYW